MLNRVCHGFGVARLGLKSYLKAAYAIVSPKLLLCPNLICFNPKNLHFRITSVLFSSSLSVLGDIFSGPCRMARIASLQRRRGSKTASAMHLGNMIYQLHPRACYHQLALHIISFSESDSL